MTSSTELPPLTSAEAVRCPYPAFAALREMAPVVRHPDVLGMAVVTRYEDVVDVLRDDEAFSNDAYEKLRTSGMAQSSTVAEILAGGYPYASVLSQGDGEEHTYHASLLKPSLTNRKVKQLEDYITHVAQDLVAGLPFGAEFDWVARVAEPLTLNVMCKFVGIAPEALDVFLKGGNGELVLLGSRGDEAELISAAKDFVELQKYAAAEIVDRQANPRDDLISRVANTTPPPGVEPLDMAGRVHIVKIAFAAGHQTTKAAMSSAALRLAQDRDLVHRVRSDDEALSRFVEESLRLDAPVLMLFRKATADAEIGGEQVAKDEHVAVCFAAANRDPAQFPNPDQLDLDRGSARHVAFGFGKHYCLGAPIARLELKIALRALVQRFEQIDVVDADALHYDGSIVNRALAALPLIGR